MAIFYLDGTTITNSTSVFTDEGLTICAADGFYSDGVISRELVNCNLLPSQTCGSCAEPCGDAISGTGGAGMYKLDIEVGGTNNDTGAIVISLDVGLIPDGIRATYNSIVYNKVSGTNDGFSEATSGQFNFVGADYRDCSIVANSPHTLAVKTYANGVFTDTGTTEIVNVVPGDMNLGDDPDAVYLVVPKPTAQPSIVSIEVVGPCSTTGWTIGVNCPTKLTGFQGSVVTSDLQCDINPSVTYYNVPVNGSAGTPGLYDWIFIDPDGVTLAADGFINLVGSPHPYIGVANGVVTQLGNCNPNAYIIQDCITSQNWVVAQGTYSFNVGDVVQYKIGDPGTGDVKCGTIIEQLNRDGGFDAQIVASVSYACDDKVHCP